MENSVTDRKIRYFFAYHLVNGLPFAFKYVEDDGIVVGGIPDIVFNVEITKEEFDVASCRDLEKEFPYPEKVVAPTTAPPEPESG